MYFLNILWLYKIFKLFYINCHTDMSRNSNSQPGRLRCCTQFILKFGPITKRSGDFNDLFHLFIWKPINLILNNITFTNAIQMYNKISNYFEILFMFELLWQWSSAKPYLKLKSEDHHPVSLFSNICIYKWLKY